MTRRAIHHGRRAARTIGIAALAFVAIGCGNAPESPEGTTDRSGAARLGWTLEEEYRVGGVSAADALAFGDVAAVAFGPTGRLYVIDGDAHHVVVLDEGGRIVRTLGEPGEGPGSLAWPTGLVVTDDGRVVVLDSARRRWVRFGPDGQVLPEIAITDDVDLPQGPLALHASGRVMGTRADDLEGTGPRTVVLHAVADAPSGDPQADDPVTVWNAWRPPTPAGRSLTPEETGGLRVRLPPLVGFHPHVHAVPLPDGRIVVADSTNYRLRAIDVGGTVVESIERAIEPSPVTEALRSAERERRLADLEADPPAMMVSDADGQAMGVADDPVMRLERARIDAMGFHAEVPVIAGLMVDSEGRLWVLRAGEAPGIPGPIELHDADLQPIGTLPGTAVGTPAALGPGGRVAQVVFDEFGAPIVSVSRLAR